MSDSNKKDFDLSVFLDSKVRILQNIPYMVIGFGIYVVARKLKVASKFTSLKMIHYTYHNISKQMIFAVFTK